MIPNFSRSYLQKRDTWRINRDSMLVSATEISLARDLMLDEEMGVL